MAVAASYARHVYRHQGVKRVAIVDFDVHHGSYAQLLYSTLDFLACVRMAVVGRMSQLESPLPLSTLPLCVVCLRTDRSSQLPSLPSTNTTGNGTEEIVENLAPHEEEVRLSGPDHFPWGQVRIGKNEQYV